MRTILLGLCLLVACGGNDPTPTPAPGEPDAATTPPPDGLPVPNDGGEVRSCGGFAGMPCAAREYCDYPENTCGVADGTGTCKPRPAACPALVAAREVCGCDSKVHASECAAGVDGTDLNANGSCDKVAGKFACGYLFCDLSNEYCRAEPHAGSAETYSCVTLPVCRTAPSCACLAGERCGTQCEGDDKVGLTLTCPTAP
jgi:hypothetical protein